MLRVLGSRKRLCDGLARRDFLQVGSIGLAGLGLDSLLRIQAAQAAPRPASLLENSFGKAKQCILLYLFGAASQVETFDVKPEAPLEVRGELQTIPSSVPGLQVCELLPHTAQMADQMTVVRSMTHPYPIHGSAYSITSTPVLDIPM